MSELPLGTRLQNGAFTVGKVLGQGGFGITYGGGDMTLRRVVAIKEFFPEGCVRQANAVQPRGAMSAAEYSSAKSKFLEEARTLAKFRHPGIVAVHTFFEENNTAYMVMEYLKGKTLAQLVAERGALPESEAIALIQKIGAALEELHRFQLLHRDVKPENVIICEDGRTVLIDFGLTKKVEEVIGLGTRQLAATTRFGSDGFAPPEQYLRSGALGKYTDVYALGATLYFLLTREIPISAPERAMGEMIRPVHQINSTISQNISDVVTKALALDKDTRPQNTPEFLQALKPTTHSVSTQSTSDLDDLPRIATSSSRFSPLVPSPSTPKDCGRCERCGGLYSLGIRRCGICRALLPWAKSQIPIALQTPPRTIISTNTEQFLKAIEQAPHGSTIQLSSTSYFLDSSILIRKSLRIEGKGQNISRIICHAEGYVMRFEGGWDWSIYGVTFEHTGSMWANVVEVEDGTINFRECSFKGGSKDNLDHQAKRGGNGLRIRMGVQGKIEKCDFHDNNACGIVYDKEAQILVNANRYWSNDSCEICSGTAKTSD